MKLRTVLALGAVALGALCLMGAPSLAYAGGSDSATPYTVDATGITLPAGVTFKDNGHVNVKTNLGDKGIHFESLNNQPSGQWIGKNFLPWSAFGLDTSKVCVTWVQIAEYNEHFGEGGQKPVGHGCVTESPSPSPTPTETVTASPSPSPTVTETPRPTATPTVTPKPSVTPTQPPVTPSATPTPTETGSLIPPHSVTASPTPEPPKEQVTNRTGLKELPATGSGETNHGLYWFAGLVIGAGVIAFVWDFLYGRSENEDD